MKQKKQKTTQKDMAVFYAVSKNTLVNWQKPTIQKNEATGEEIEFFPPTGRHNLFRASKLYYMLCMEDEYGNSKLDSIFTALEELEDAKSLLDTKGEIVAGDVTVSYADMGKQKLRNSLETLSELKNMIKEVESLNALRQKL